MLGCRNPKKAVNYSCSDYKALKDHADIFSLLDKFETAPAAAKPKPKIIRVHKKLVTADALGNFPPPDDDDLRLRDDPFNQDDLADVWDKTKEAEYEKSLREDNDFYRAMRDGYDSLTNTVKDMRIDDGDFSLALNCYDFACNFMGKHAKKPFARQLWIMVVLAAEYCPRCAEPGFLNVENVPVDADPDDVADRMCLLRHGVCPRCGTGKAEMILSGELRDFVELVACLGQRSGKTVVSNTLTAYWIHRILMIPPYSQLCNGVQDFSPITFTLVALSFSRAQKLLWSPLVAVFKTSNFFIDYHEMMKHQSRKYGVELMSLRKSSLFYAHKNLEIAPMGPMKRTLRGDTRAGACFVGSTLVHTDNGLMKIGDPAIRGRSVTLGKETYRVSAHIPQGKRRINRVVLGTGATFDCTLDHRFKVLNPDYSESLVEAQNLTGYYLPIELGGSFGDGDLSDFAPDSHRSDKRVRLLRRIYEGSANFAKQDSYELGYVLGCIVAGGSYNNEQEFGYGTKDVNRGRTFHAYAEDVLGLELVHLRLDDYYCTRFSTANVRSFFRWLGLKPATARVKEIPSKVLTGSYDMTIGYLSGHLISDGTMVGDQPVWATTSRVLAQQILTLLARVGILGTVRSVPYGTLFNVRVAPEFLGRFQQRIGSRLPIPKFKYGRTHTSQTEQRIPTQTPSYFAAPYFRPASSTDVLPHMRRRSTLDRTDLPNKLRDLIQRTPKEVFYVPVVAVKDLGRSENVYDITVDSKDHLFRVGVGAPVHNSVDELGWFPLPPVTDEDADNGNPEEVEREIANADEVYVALDRSLMTIRSGVYDLYRKGYNHIPNGLGLYTSSPAAYRDKICTMLRESEGSVRSLGVNLPTWEVNPLISRDYPDIVEAYRKNAVKAERDWGAKPPNLNAAIYSRETLAPLFTGTNHFAVTRVVTSTGKLYGRVLPLKRKWAWPGSVLALDAGMVNNSFAYAVVNGRYQDNIIGADVTSVGEVIPSRETPINFPLIYEHCLKPLIKATNVKFVVADRWNSAMLLQTIERDFPGVLTFYVTLRAADFDKADADFINSGLVTMPVMETTMDEAERVTDYRAAFSTPPKPASHLFLQFRTIRKMLINRTKGERNTDDIYRAVMLGLTCLRHPKMEETLRKSRLINTSVGDPGVRPVVSGRAYGLLR